MIAVLTICTLFAICAALEEICNTARRALACHRARKNATWRARRVTIHYPR